jgi:hypothetical protein
MDVKFKIAEESFYNNGRIVLDSLESFESLVRNAFSETYDMTDVTREESGRDAYLGIGAGELNVVLRDLVADIPEINKETHVEHGIFFHNTKEGFDFSIYDKKYNLARLYNYYMGSVGILNGDKKIYDIFKKMKMKKFEWKKVVDELKVSVDCNTDLKEEKNLLTVAGEIQFGNWAMTYRDLFRLLNAEKNPGIDFYVYVTATGRLSELLSAQTADFNKTQKIIEENIELIKTPIWVIGLDIE